MPVAIDPGLPVRAVFLDAGGVQRQRMVLQPEAFFSGNRMLAAFDVVVKKLFHPTAIHAHKHWPRAGDKATPGPKL